MKNFFAAGALFGMIFLLVCIAPFILWLLWEPIAVNIFNLPDMTFWQTFGLYMICNILFKPINWSKRNA